MGVSLDRAEILKIAAEAQVDPRTVALEVECPGTVRTHGRERVRRALALREQLEAEPVTSAEQGRAIGLRLLDLRAQIRKHAETLPELSTVLESFDVLQRILDRAMARSARVEFQEELRAYKTNKREKRAQARIEQKPQRP